LPESILKAIEKVGYKKPSGVQMQCIPLGLACKDVIGVAKTGSGKTCAFVLPMLVYILKQPPITKENAGEGPLALIMAPTRELVQQIEEEARKFAQELKIRVYSVVGGEGWPVVDCAASDKDPVVDPGRGSRLWIPTPFTILILTPFTILILTPFTILILTPFTILIMPATSPHDSPLYSQYLRCPPLFSALFRRALYRGAVIHTVTRC
jgi:hypothetical protein